MLVEIVDIIRREVVGEAGSSTLVVDDAKAISASMTMWRENGLHRGTARTRESHSQAREWSGTAQPRTERACSELFQSSASTHGDGSG